MKFALMYAFRSNAKLQPNVRCPPRSTRRTPAAGGKVRPPHAFSAVAPSGAGRASPTSARRPASGVASPLAVGGKSEQWLGRLQQIPALGYGRRPCVAIPDVYSYSKCSTCRKALKWLEQHGLPYRLRDIVTEPPSVEQLRRALTLAQVPVKKLFNTSGASYRDGGYGVRLHGMSDEQALQALASDGKLIKRPLLIGPDFALVGFDEAAYRARFLD